MFTTPTQEEINAAMRKLGEMGWITSSAQVGTKGQMNLTQKGADRMARLSLALCEIGTVPVGVFSAIAAMSMQVVTNPLVADKEPRDI